MGAITDPSVLDSENFERIVREVVEPTLKGAAQEGFAFRGVLFIGLMLTAEGPKVLEYNVRFGDPETQAILMRLKSDLFGVFNSVVDGNLKNFEVEWSEESSACVVLASQGYPGPLRTGLPISGLESLATNREDMQVFHAGTSKSDDQRLVTSGGRVLGVTALGATLEAALESCYEAIKPIQWEGMQYRRDIGRFKEVSKASSTEPG
jgi:phosphoribosylamine--glycine ligase